VMCTENRLEFREGVELVEGLKESFWNCRSAFLAFRLHSDGSIGIVPSIRQIVIWAFCHLQWPTAGVLKEVTKNFPIVE